MKILTGLIRTDKVIRKNCEKVKGAYKDGVCQHPRTDSLVAVASTNCIGSAIALAADKFGINKGYVAIPVDDKVISTWKNSYGDKVKSLRKKIGVCDVKLDFRGDSKVRLDLIIPTIAKMII